MRYFTLLLLTLLSGCSTLEYRSDMLPRKKLAEIENQHQIDQVWEVEQEGDKNRLLVADYKNKLVTVTSSGTLTLVNQNGEIAWRKNTDINFSSTPVVEGDDIIIGTSDAKVVSFNAITGKVNWKSNVTGEVLATPTVKDGVIYIHTLDGKVNALDKNTGNKIWQHGTNSPTLVLRKSGSPVVIGDKVLLGSSSGSVVSLKKETGVVDWEQEIGSTVGLGEIQRMKDISADVIVADGKVFAVSFQGNLAALSADTGYILWTKDISSFVGMTKNKDSLYIADNNGYVWCVETSQGIVRWKQKELQGRFLSKPVIYKNYVAVGDDDGFLHLLSKEDGSILSRKKVGNNPIEEQPVIKGENIIIPQKGGSLTAYNIK